MNKDACCLIRRPKLAVVYIYALNGQQGFANKAVEFAASYHRNPPGLDHETVIVCNGAPATDPSKDLFRGLPNLVFLDHDNSGWDIGGFQMAARNSDADMMLFCGAHAYFRQPGWLIRMWETFVQFGDTLYGCTGNQGDLRFGVHPHVRTTGFWCSPNLLANYPKQVRQQGGGGGSERYESEHGQGCITNWVKSLGRQPYIVGWDSIFPLEQCDSMPNGYHQGDQSNVLVGDRMTCPPYHSTP